MMNPSHSILNADITHASVGGAPTADPLSQICYYTSVEFNLAKANFINQSSSVKNDQVELRLHVMNGDFETARKIFENSEAIQDIEARADYCLAEAQTLCHQAQWLEAVAVTEKGLRLKPAHITQISLIQCRALALYEMGHFDKALKDCEMVVSQQDLYGKAVAVKYSKVLKAKILLAKEDMIAAHALYRSLLNVLIQGPLDLDFLLTLLRLKIDLNRTLCLPIENLATACFEVSTRLQDPLYAAMAEFDFYTSLVNPDSTARKPLVQGARRFEKVLRWLDQYDQRKASSTSERRHLLTRRTNECSSMEKGFRFIITPEGYLFDLQEKTTLELNIPEKIVNLCRTMQRGPVDRATFFESVWEQKYNYEKHDGVIRSFLYRLRKNTPLETSSRDGKIHFSATLFL